MELRAPDGRVIDTLAYEHEYVFHQADIGRTWTEISWLEWGVIALIGGIVFTGYDVDQTPVFIEAVGPGYGGQVATRISNRLAQGVSR